MAETEFTAEMARALFSYESATGFVRWRVAPRYGVNVGDLAGCLSADGYRRVRTLGRNWLEHRLAWLLVIGAWPTKQIDHMNGCRSDNRWCNLRNVTAGENQQNQRLGRSKGLRGAYRDRDRWRSHIKVNGNLVRLGSFDTAEAASAAYMAAKRDLHPAFTA